MSAPLLLLLILENKIKRFSTLDENRYYLIVLCPSDGTLNVSPLLRITTPWHAKDFEEE